ncbi:NB-ARC domain-containing protein [Aphanothece sacrum]|uniref:WD40 repeat-containing protein n=1 Tax=Aphanothece sacrum FPU1 TaxID=1920663 RepID=A0A401IDM8_APHSA|nr:NB-ARC domain-containing protein [Aphanothece sacrum]GBF79324.1 WD40 repeat-containing protein [Aphanothece sacrum FPU1]GBF86826.1 WD repeat-containing protein [Aphanothece sacrum FPU3]
MSKLRVKPEYVKKVELALQKSNFTSKTILADRLYISRATITKFFNSEGVGSEKFQDICRALWLDWQEISENENVEVEGEISHDWGTAPEIDDQTFYGRNEELNTLEKWIITDKFRLICLSGIVGMGKTALGVKFAQDNEDKFDVIIYRSLKSAPNLINLLEDILKGLNNHSLGLVLPSLEKGLARLIDSLRKYRCLLLLDDVEEIFCKEALAGKYKDGYEDYQKLWRRISEAPHNSCLLMINREKPSDFDYLENRQRQVNSLYLSGLKEKEIDSIFQEQGILGKENELTEIEQLYRGNPLFLKLVGARIKEVFGGNITDFLEYATRNFSDVNLLIEMQYERLSEVEKAIIQYLAKVENPVMFAQLRQEIKQPGLTDGVASLTKRALIERSEAGFIIQKLVKLYVDS